MKKIILGVVALAFSSLVIAEEINPVTEENPPYNYTDKGKVTGISTEIVDAVMKKAGMTGKINVYPWSRAYKEAQEKPNTLIFAMSRTPARESMFKWVGVVGPTKFYMYSKKDKNLKISSIEDAKKYKSGTVPQDVMDLYLIEKGFKVGTNIEQVNDYELNLKKLFAGNIDFVPMPELVANFIAKKIGKDINQLDKSFFIEERSKEGYYMAFSKQTKDEIVNKVKEAYEALKKDSTIDNIMKKY